MPHPDVGPTHPLHISRTIQRLSVMGSFRTASVRSLCARSFTCRRGSCSSLLAIRAECHPRRNLPSPAMPGHSLCVGGLGPALWWPRRYIYVHLAVVRGDDYLSVRYHGRAKFAEVKCIVGDVLAIPKQFQTRRSIGVVDWVQCRRIVSPQNSFNDMPVRIA